MNLDIGSLGGFGEFRGPRKRCGGSGMMDFSNGMLHLPRCDHHEPEKDDFDGRCSLCGGLVWTDKVVEHFRAMRPLVPALCCVCAQLSVRAVTEAFPGLNWQFDDVPDLAKLGTFN